MPRAGRSPTGFFCDRPTGSGEAPAKECPDCHSLIATGYAACPECGHEFPPRQHQGHDATASTEAVLSGQTLRQLHFREKYGLTVLAIWRKGTARKDEFRDLADQICTILKSRAREVIVLG